MPGGGAATNSGIDFQHRVGALAMVAMLTDLTALHLFGLSTADHRISELRFETDDSIDDLLILTDGPRVFVQAKRSLSLSVSETAEFSSVLGQFVSQFVAAPQVEDVYLLATTPSASGRIVRDLRKLTEAARLNELGPETNPLTKTETEVLANTRQLLERNFARRTGRALGNEEYLTIFRRIHVAILDLEFGGSLERAVLTVLASRATVAPTLVWGSLVSLGLSLAKNRLSIDKKALTDRVGEFFHAWEQGDRAVIGGAIAFAFEDQFAAGREIVLAKYEDRLLLMELYRFAEDGTRRLLFTDGKVRLQGDLELEVLHRTSTMKGMERLLLANPAALQGREVVIAPINSDDDPESSPWAQAHAELCKQMMQANTSLLDCLRCGRVISEDLAPAVEIDQEGQSHEVGFVHSQCLLSTDRIIGGLSSELFRSGPAIVDFDYQSWFETRPTGQGAFNGTPAGLRSRLLPIAWKPGRDHLSVGSWGVEYILEDDSSRYVHERGHVLRLVESQAIDIARYINGSLAAALAEKDPFCISEETGTFGTHSVLFQNEPGARLLAVASAEPRQLSRSTIVAHNLVDNYYAPLVALINADTNMPFTISDATVLLTDPFRLTDSLKNWEAAGVVVPAVATVIIRSDDQFDAMIAGGFLDGVGAVVDPILNMSGTPVAGYVIEYFGDIVNSPPGAP